MHYSLETLKTLKMITLLTVIITLQGCVVAAVATVGTGVKVATDRRSVGHQIDDQTIELNFYNQLSKNKTLNDNVNIQAVSLNGTLLLVGQTPTQPLHNSVLAIAQHIDGVANIYDQIRIANTTSILTKSHDTWITSKVKFALLADKTIDGTNIKVVTENGEVFLMGLVSHSEADAAVNIARNIKGVNRVLKAFEYR